MTDPGYYTFLADNPVSPDGRDLFDNFTTF
jgi:hypothetical protein